MGVRAATATATSSLWGMVTDSPRMPRVRAPATAAAAPPGATGKATDTQSTPRWAKAVLWSSGESEWATG